MIAEDVQFNLLPIPAISMVSLISRCKGNYYGRQCELDGEVVAVAIGASVAAIIIIILTLTCLCMWR